MQQNKKVWVEIPGGDLVLSSQEAIDLFNRYCESGTLWELLSVLFNDYAENGRRTDNVIKEQKATQEMLQLIMKQMTQTGFQLPSPSQNDGEVIIEPKGPIKVEDYRPKKAEGSLASKLNLMKKFK